MGCNHLPRVVTKYPNARESKATIPRLAVAHAGLDAHTGYDGSVAIGSERHVLVCYRLVGTAPARQLIEVLRLGLNTPIGVCKKPVNQREAYAGSAAATRTSTACCDSTSRRGRALQAFANTTAIAWQTSSTRDRESGTATRHAMKDSARSQRCCTWGAN